MELKAEGEMEEEGERVRTIKRLESDWLGKWARREKWS
jgi:hypothetical protein